MRNNDGNGWTFETLTEFWDMRFRELDLRHNQQHDSQALSVAAALEAANLATAKAERAVEQRFQSVNEFRSTLSDQAAQFITRTEAQASIDRNSERIAEVTTRLHDTSTKNEVVNGFKIISDRMAELTARSERNSERGIAQESLLTSFDHRLTLGMDEQEQRAGVKIAELERRIEVLLVERDRRFTSIENSLGERLAETARSTDRSAERLTVLESKQVGSSEHRRNLSANYGAVVAGFTMLILAASIIVTIILRH